MDVILVNEKDQPVGTMEKMEAHQKALLHRAFSVFIFNDKGEMLLQKRAANKYHSAGLWTNACCSHPRPGSDTLQAAGERLQEEMGFITKLEKVFDFIYRASYDNGLTEYEFDHVLVGTYAGEIIPNPEEVADFCFIMHGFLWYLHEDHHKKRPGFFEKNDAFFLIFAIPCWLCIMLGMQFRLYWLSAMGAGIALLSCANIFLQ